MHLIRLGILSILDYNYFRAKLLVHVFRRQREKINLADSRSADLILPCRQGEVFHGMDVTVVNGDGSCDGQYLMGLID